MSFIDRLRRLHDYAWLMLLLTATLGRADGEIRPEIRTWAARLCGELADAYHEAGRIRRARHFARQAEFWNPDGSPRPPARAAAMVRPADHSVIEARGRCNTGAGAGTGTMRGALPQSIAPTPA